MGNPTDFEIEFRAFVDFVCQRFPKVFVHPYLKGRGMLPLSLSMSDQLKAALPDRDAGLIDRFLHFYVTRFWYYRCLTGAASPRICLDESFDGRVTVAEADDAQKHHDRLLKNRARSWVEKTCSGTGKTIYPSGGAALAAASRVRRSLGDRQETSTYRCSHCGRFHWGHDVEQHRAGERVSAARDMTAMKHSKRHIETLMLGE